MFKSLQLASGRGDGLRRTVVELTLSIGKPSDSAVTLNGITRIEVTKNADGFIVDAWLNDLEAARTLVALYELRQIFDLTVAKVEPVTVSGNAKVTSVIATAEIESITAYEIRIASC